jgi:polynucleotide 5'-hydroxyl-kinase GRC3/NOL9
LSAFAARKALASSPSKAARDQNGRACLGDTPEESKSVSSGLADSRLQAGNGMSSLAIMAEESAPNPTFMDLDENTQLSSYA